MLDTSARLLRLLTTLQTRRNWSGTELAERLEVTPRTLRRDVERLRSLGYSVQASSGPGGGYQLGSGTELPPLLLDDDEAVALAAALRSAAATLVGAGDKVMSLLVKLEEILPRRLQRRVGALQAMTVSVGSGAHVDAETLIALAAACRDGLELSFEYTAHDGKSSLRRVEPLRVAHTGNRRWYLVAWDVERAAWRTFRVDRVQAPKSGARFVPRPPPPDIEKYVSESISAAPYRHRARLRLFGSAREMKKRVPPWVGVIEPVDTKTSVLTIGADRPEALIAHIVHAGVDFELLEPEDLRPELSRMAQRFAQGSRKARKVGARQAKRK